MAQDPHASMAEVGGQVILEVIDPATNTTVVFTGPDDEDVERQVLEHFGAFPNK